jgi:hypothetical protein
MLSNISFFTQVAIFGHGQEGQVEVQTLPPDPYTPKFDPIPSIYLLASWKASDEGIPWEGERNDARRDLHRPAGSAGEGRLDVGLIIPPQEYGVWLPPRRMRKNLNTALVKDHSHAFDGSKVEDTSQVCYYDDSQHEFSDVLDEASNQEFLEEEWDSISEFSDHIPHGKDAYTEQLRPCRQPFVS